MATQKKFTTLDDFEDQFIGERGTPERDTYEVELQVELLSEAIKELREKLNLTQSEVGERIGVKKSQILRLEHSEGQMNIVTALRIFKALNARVKMVIEYDAVVADIDELVPDITNTVAPVDSGEPQEPTFYKELELVH